MAQPVVARNAAELQINVAHLLKGAVGIVQRVQLVVPGLPLGEERVARHVDGVLKLLKLDRGLLVTGPLSACVELTCMRCLEEYQQPIEFEVEDEYRPTVDIGSGTPLGSQDDEADAEFFLIGDNHVLDLAEAVRQAIWLAVPMIPRCRDDCTGIATVLTDAEAHSQDHVDERLAVLAALLGAIPDRRKAERPVT